LSDAAADFVDAVVAAPDAAGGDAGIDSPEL
jgi:hypothetical protein